MHRYACGCSSRPLWHSSQQIRPPGEYLYIEFVLKVSSRLFSSSPIFAHIRTPILQASRTQGHQGPILPLHRIPRGQDPDRLIVHFFCQGLGIGTCVCMQVCVSMCQWLARTSNLTIQKGGSLHEMVIPLRIRARLVRPRRKGGGFLRDRQRERGCDGGMEEGSEEGGREGGREERARVRAERGLGGRELLC